MKMHRRLINTLLLIAPMLALGCATLVVGDKQSLTFDSQPAGPSVPISVGHFASLQLE